MAIRNEYIRIRMSEEEKDNLKYLATKWNLTMADTIRELVDQKIDIFRKSRLKMIMQEKQRVAEEITMVLTNENNDTNRKFGLYCNGDGWQIFNYKDVKKTVDFLLYNFDDLILKFDDLDKRKYDSLCDGEEDEDDEVCYWADRLEEYIDRNI